MKRITLFLRQLVLLTLLACLPALGASTWQPTGYWTGQLNYRGDALGVRIEIRDGGTKYTGRLDIPALVYANQPMAISYDNEQSLSLEFPFGIGTFTVRAARSDQLLGEREGFSLQLARAPAPLKSQIEISFGAIEPNIAGTLYLPEGDGPHPVVLLVAGSGQANRESWSYSSWVEFYVEQGIGAFIYDRRPDLETLPDGSIAGIEDHAADVVDAIRKLKLQPNVDVDRIGLAGGSRGAWIAMSVSREIIDIAFLLLTSPAAATPGEQEVTSVLTGMRQDGMDTADIAKARAYLRLYFYAAQTDAGWELLSSAMADGDGSNWLQYVDQPRTPEDLDWWQANMNFDAIDHLEKIKAPVLALWGGNDFITPWADYRLKLESALKAAGNDDVTTHVFPGADHRLEIGFGEGADGAWHWFGLAPGALESIRVFIRRVTQPSLAIDQ